MCMPNKEGRYSFQAYLVCKSHSGYLDNVEVYAGKSQTKLIVDSG